MEYNSVHKIEMALEIDGQASVGFSVCKSPSLSTHPSNSLRMELPSFRIVEAHFAYF
jgi:hypothetical protein